MSQVNVDKQYSSLLSLCILCIEHNVTVHSHVYKTAEQHTRSTDRCRMQIRSPVVCDVSKVAYISQKHVLGR